MTVPNKVPNKKNSDVSEDLFRPSAGGRKTGAERVEQIKKKAKNIRRTLDQLSDRDPKNVRAIALNYEFGKKKAPRIVATGRGKIAENILQLAEENQVPLYEDENLTELLSKLDLDTEIPPQLFTLVAEVLAVVYQMNKLSNNKSKSN